VSFCLAGLGPEWFKYLGAALLSFLRVWAEPTNEGALRAPGILLFVFFVFAVIF